MGAGPARPGSRSDRTHAGLTRTRATEGCAGGGVECERDMGYATVDPTRCAGGITETPREASRRSLHVEAVDRWDTTPDRGTRPSTAPPIAIQKRLGRWSRAGASGSTPRWTPYRAGPSVTAAASSWAARPPAPSSEQARRLQEGSPAHHDGHGPAPRESWERQAGEIDRAAGAARWRAGGGRLIVPFNLTYGWPAGVGWPCDSRSEGLPVGPPDRGG